MSALPTDAVAPETNRYALSNSSAARVKCKGKQVRDPWARVLGGLDAALGKLEQLALNDKPVPAEDVGLIAVVALRGNPMMSQGQLRRLHAGCSPVVAQEVVYAGLGPVLVHKTYKRHPEHLEKLVEDASYEHSNLEDDVDAFQAAFNREPLNRIQIWNQQAIASAEETIKSATDLDDTRVKEARAVLIQMKCGPVKEEDLNEILRTPDDDPLTPWIPPVREPKPVKQPKRRGRGNKVRARYIPSDDDVALATSLMKAPINSRHALAMRRRAEVVLEFHKDPEVSLLVVAKGMGVSRPTVEKVLAELLDAKRFEMKQPKSRAVRQKTPRPTKSMVRKIYVPNHEDVALAKSIMDEVKSGHPVRTGLRQRAQVILAFDADPHVSRTELARTIGATPMALQMYRKEFEARGGFKFKGSNEQSQLV